jgi:hypothetical protein
VTSELSLIRKHVPIALLIILIAQALPAIAGHSDIILLVESDQLVTANEDNVPMCAFEGDVNEGTVPGFTIDPGFASEELAPGALVGFNVTQGLRFWDGAALVVPPQDEYLDITLVGSTVVTVTGQSGKQAGVNFAQANGSGGMHQHLGFFVKHPSWSQADPFNNPYTVGAYVLYMEITSSMHSTSGEFAIVLNAGLAVEEFEEAVQYVVDACASCPADLDADGDIDLADLGTLLAAFGIDGGGDTDGDGDTDLADLGSLLAAFGTACP